MRSQVAPRTRGVREAPRLSRSLILRWGPGSRAAQSREGADRILEARTRGVLTAEGPSSLLELRSLPGA